MSVIIPIDIEARAREARSAIVLLAVEANLIRTALGDLLDEVEAERKARIAREGRAFDVAPCVSQETLAAARAALGRPTENGNGEETARAG